MAQAVKHLAYHVGDPGSVPGSEDPPEEEMATHSRIFLPGKSHGRRRLVGYSPWGRKRVGHDLSTEQHQKQQQSAGNDQTQSDCGHKDGGNKEGGSGKEGAMSRCD